MHALKNKLWKEIDEIAQKPALGAGDLELLHVLTDTVKNLCKIEMLDGDGDGYSGRSRHWVRGHYSRDGRPDMDRDGYAGARRDARGRYSRDGRDEMLDHLTAAMEASSEQDREAIRRLMDKIGNM